MAVWQFKFTIFSRAGLRQRWGNATPQLDEYIERFHGPEWEMPEEPYHNYWENNASYAPLCKALASLLPEGEHWADDARFFGSKGGDTIELWPDDIDIRLTQNRPNAALLEVIVTICQQYDCQLCLSESGQLIDPDLATLQAAIRLSNAAAFCANPHGYLQELGD